MDIDEFEYVWTTRKGDFVLVKDDYGYAIVDKRERAVLLIEDDVATRPSSPGCSGRVVGTTGTSWTHTLTCKVAGDVALG